MRWLRGLGRRARDPYGRALAPIYLQLRSQVLGLDPATIDLVQTEGRPLVWAALFELGYPNGVATIVAMRDGTASMYTSSGGGVIGGAGRPAVAAEAVRFVVAVEADLDALTPTDDPPLPAPDWTLVTARTFDGPRSAGAATAELSSGDHALSRIYLAGHDLVAKLRMAAD